MGAPRGPAGRPRRPRRDPRTPPADGRILSSRRSHRWRWLALEVGEGQAAAVGELLREAGFWLSNAERTWRGSSGSWWGDDDRGRLDRGDGADAARSALERCIAAGGVAVFPADGLYGLACDPLDAAAIERIHRIKGRDDGKPSAVLYFSPLAMRELVEGLGPRTREAVGALLPGPVTLVVANPQRRYPLACREDPERLGCAADRRPAGRGDVPDLPDLGESQRRACARPVRRGPGRGRRRGRPRDRRRRARPACRRRSSTSPASTWAESGGSCAKGV